MTSHGKTSGVSTLECVVVLGVCAGAGALGALYLGQDINYDQRNYHLYIVYAWLHGRTTQDLAAAQIQSWLNPLPYVHNYLLIRYAPPVVAGMVTGAVAVANGLLLWILARRLIDGRWSRWCAGFAAVTGVTGSMFLSFLGTTFGEGSAFVLTGLLCATWGVSGRTSDPRRLFAAGCFVGAGCGVKLTNLVYALGLTATLFVLMPWLKPRVRSLLMYAIGGLTGFLATGGYWSAKMWLAFGNPTFPFFNGFFQSPMYPPVTFVDLDYLPKSFSQAAVTYPFEWLLGLYRPANPLFFREPRFAIIAALLPLAMVVTLLRSSDREQAQDESSRVSTLNFWLIGLFFVFSYAVWLMQFGVQRYILNLELLSGVVLLVSLARVLRNSREVAVVLGLLTIACILWTRPSDWLRMPYGEDWFGLPRLEANAAATLYVMPGAEPTAYVIPYMATRDRFIRLKASIPVEPGTPIGQRALRMIYAHDGPIRSLTVGVADQDPERLQRFGLSMQPETCRSFQSRIDTFWTCGLVRSPASQVGP